MDGPRYFRSCINYILEVSNWIEWVAVILRYNKNNNHMLDEPRVQFCLRQRPAHPDGIYAEMFSESADLRHLSLGESAKSLRESANSAKVCVMTSRGIPPTGVAGFFR